MSDNATIVVRIDPIEPGDPDRVRAWLAGHPVTPAAQVEVHEGRAVHAAMGNDTEPQCAQCGRPAAWYLPFERVDAWYDGGPEPTFSCDACGWTAHAGDWPGEFALALGYLAVEFRNHDAPLEAAFVSDVGRCSAGVPGWCSPHW